DAMARRVEDLLEVPAYVAFRRRVARALAVGAVGQQRQHSFLPELGETSVVAGSFIRRGLVELEVSGVNYRSYWRCYRHPHAVRDTVRDREKLEAHPAQLDHVAGADRMKGGANSVLAQPPLREPDRERRRVDRNRQLLQDVGECADMVLVTVGEDDGCDFVAV